jgi:hypothetical protein
MRVGWRSGFLSALALVVFLAVGTTASAQNKCISGKGKCSTKKSSGIAKCYSKAYKDGTTVGLTACVDKAKAKFDGDNLVPPAPAKGCYEKLEGKDEDGPGPIAGEADCATFDDTDAMEAKIDAFIDDLLDELITDYPAFPAGGGNKCRAAKVKCAYKKAESIIKCHVKRAKDPAFAGAAFTECVDKARAKFDGSLLVPPNPAKGCFEKAENKQDPMAPETLCDTEDDTAAIEAKVDDFVQDVLCELGYGAAPVGSVDCGPTPTPTPTLTPTPSPSPTCPPASTFQGALVPTLGRFNYNLTLGLPGANSACSTSYGGAHACTYFELQCAELAGGLVGATDTSAALVNSFWAIIPTAPPLTQCVDDVLGGSNLNWEYATAHTASRGSRVTLNNPAGTLGALATNLQCNASGTSNVGCCL